MSRFDEYNRILGLIGNPSQEQIKKAYREKAKQFHPDRNKNPGAHDQFILLNEAYEYLLSAGKPRTNTNSGTTQYDDWMFQEREKAKARARSYAQMKYDEFVNSDYYRSLDSVSTIVEYFYFLFVIVLLTFLPAVIIYHFGVQGFFGSILILLISLPFIARVIKETPPFDFGKFFSSLFYILRTRWFMVGFTTLVNIITLLKIGMQTLMPGAGTITICMLTVVSTYGITQWKLRTKSKALHYFNLTCLLPLLFNLLLIINFVFSDHPEKEAYTFIKEVQASKRGYQETTYIRLEGGNYEEYPGIRLFWDFEQMRYANTITYTFKKGFFGWRVMTGFEFSEDYPGRTK